eukprot:2817103-Pleurochrysis_carterae.AAC.1
MQAEPASLAAACVPQRVSQMMPDVPYGDYFSVLTKLVLIPHSPFRGMTGTSARPHVVDAETAEAEQATQRSQQAGQSTPTRGGGGGAATPAASASSARPGAAAATTTTTPVGSKPSTPPREWRSWSPSISTTPVCTD